MILLATVLGLLILLGLTIFQIALIFGAPIGDYAWGGQHKVLTTKLRIGSVTSIVAYVVFAAFLVSKAGVWPIITNPNVLNTGMWAIVGYFTLGIVLNFISRNKKERALMTPVAALLAVSFFIVALS